MKSIIDKLNEDMDRVIAMNEAYRLGLTSKETDPGKCVEMCMLLDAIAEEDRTTARRWYGLGLVVSA